MNMHNRIPCPSEFVPNEEYIDSDAIYLLFGFNAYYPIGGYNDLLGVYPSVHDAKYAAPFKRQINGRLAVLDITAIRKDLFDNYQIAVIQGGQHELLFTSKIGKDEWGNVTLEWVSVLIDESNIDIGGNTIDD